MKNKLTKPLQNTIVFLMIAFLIAALVLWFFWYLGLRINLTASMPIGIYQKQKNKTLQRGDLVAICLPNKIAMTGIARGYIGRGNCPNHSQPLLKKVIALPGDTVVLRKNSISVNGIDYLAPQQRFDHQHQHIKHWIKNGVHPQIKGVWLYGANDPIHSWDSRYFGSITVENIQGVYKLLLITR